MRRYAKKRKTRGRRRRFKRNFRRGGRRFKRTIRRRFSRKTKWIKPRRTIYPDYIIAKLKFTDYVTITSAAGGLAQVTYRANGPYDPNPSLGGDSAYGFPEYGGIFKNYTCYGSKISIRTNNQNSMAVDAVVGIIPVASSSGVVAGTDYTTSIWTSWQNMRYMKWRMVPSIQGGNYANKVFRSVSNSMSVTKYFGISKQKVRDDDIYSAATNANPATQFYWAIVCFDLAKAANATSVLVEINMVYYVKFWNTVASDQ